MTQSTKEMNFRIHSLMDVGLCMNTDPNDQTNAKSQDVQNPSYKILIKHTLLTGSGWLLSSKLETKLTPAAKMLRCF